MKKTVIVSFSSIFLILGLLGCQAKPSGPAQQVNVVMKKYSIEPSIIKVKAGQNVQLHVTSADVQHGLLIPALGISEPVSPGKPAVVTFKAPAKGEYEVKCGIICGPHHDDMTAKLVVE